MFSFASSWRSIIVLEIDHVLKTVSTALPRIGAVFHDTEKSGWVATSYLLTSTAFQPLYGRFSGKFLLLLFLVYVIKLKLLLKSDIFGRKIMLIIALSIFFFGSLACALSRTMIQLIVFRALSGVGGGAIITLAMIISSSFLERLLRLFVLTTCLRCSFGCRFFEGLCLFYINAAYYFLRVVILGLVVRCRIEARYTVSLAYLPIFATFCLADISPLVFWNHRKRRRSVQLHWAVDRWCFYREHRLEMVLRSSLLSSFQSYPFMNKF